MINMAKNFKKSILWKQGKYDEIEKFDEYYADYIDDIWDSSNMHRLIIHQKGKKKIVETKHSKIDLAEVRDKF